MSADDPALPFNPFVGFSGTSLAMPSRGDTVTMVWQPVGLEFYPPTRLKIWADDAPEGTAYFIASVNHYNDATGETEHFVLRSFGSGTYLQWRCERYDDGGSLAPRMAISVTANVLEAGVKTFTIQTGKAALIGDRWLAHPRGSRQHADCTVIDYDPAGTSFIVKFKAAEIHGVSPISVDNVDAIAAGGTGYNRGETITLTGGTFSTAAVLTVTNVDEDTGAVTEVEITDAGEYTVFPSDPVAQGSTDGSGTGATFNLTPSNEHDDWEFELIDRAPPGIPLAGLSGLGVELVETEKVADPATLPSSTGNGVAMSPDGLTLAVANAGGTPLTIYRRTAVGADDWTKVADPATLPTSTGFGCAISPDGLTLAVAHSTSPFITIYRRTATSADDWTKIADPATLPASNGRGVAFSPDGLTLAVAHDNSPRITIYRRTAAGADDWTKIADPATLPTDNAQDCAISPDGLTLVVAHTTTPFITIYRRTAVGADDWTKVADPATLPAGNGKGCAISSDGLTLAVAHSTTPFITVYRRTAAGADDWTKVANPATLPPTNALGSAISPDGLVLSVLHTTSPFITIYRRTSTAADDWTKVTDPEALAGSGNGAAFSPDGLTLAIGHDTTPFVTIYRNPDAATLIHVKGGAIRAYDDSTDLVVTEAGTFRIHQLYEDGGLLVRAALAGTGTSTGTALTGTSTEFLADFGSGAAKAYLADYDDQITGVLRDKSIVTAGAVSSGVASVSSDTAAVTVTDLGASGSALKRGGYFFGTFYLGIGVAFKDTDGSTTKFVSALTGSGVPDLPSGHSRYRIAALLRFVNGDLTEVLQPLTGQSIPDADEIDQDNSNGLGAKVQDALNTLAGAPRVIDSDTFSGASTVDIFFPAGYTAFQKLVLDFKFTVGTDAAELFARLSTAAAFETGVGDYDWWHETRPATTGVLTLTPDNSDSEIELCLNVEATNGGGNLTITIRDPAGTARRPTVRVDGEYIKSTLADVVHDVIGMGSRRTQQDCDGIQLLPSTGTISGSWSLTGYP